MAHRTRFRLGAILLAVFGALLMIVAQPGSASAGGRHHGGHRHGHDGRGHHAHHRHGHHHRGVSIAFHLPYFAHYGYDSIGHHHSYYASRYYCEACHHYFGSYDAFSYHIHHHHQVPLLELPFVIVHSVIHGVAILVFSG